MSVRTHFVMRASVPLLLVIALLCPIRAFAWGPQGHALITDIATRHLDSQTRQAVSRLLADGSYDSLDQIASWADAIRHKRRETGPWHYVDIPRYARGYRARRDCPHKNCVVTRIPHFVRILKNRSNSEAKRLEALKFVVHFVADAQQPMHAINNHDAGGNDVKLRYFGHWTNLHRVWDSGIIQRALHLHTGRNYTIDRKATRKAAMKLNRDISTDEAKRWSRVLERSGLNKAVIHWVNQSHALARDVAYRDLPNNSHKSWSAYQHRAWAVEKRQLQRGGIRLAAVLNSVFSSSH